MAQPKDKFSAGKLTKGLVTAVLIILPLLFWPVISPVEVHTQHENYTPQPAIQAAE